MVDLDVALHDTGFYMILSSQDLPPFVEDLMLDIGTMFFQL